jgi:hypothetical protein
MPVYQRKAFHSPNEGILRLFYKNILVPDAQAALHTRTKGDYEHRGRFVCRKYFENPAGNCVNLPGCRFQDLLFK